ncbi:MAG: T9SS type A sorting domain-containing protein [Flavobacteriales bacterium]|nr:T9SS type A sorting domain-containing protein [Flavobacteriales bacterium]
MVSWLKIGLLSISAVLLTPLSAQVVSLYSFSSGTGTTLDPMSGATVLIGANQDDVSSAVTGIGFTFNFEGVDHTQFSTNSNGGMRFGGTAIGSSAIYNLTQSGDDPKVLPFSADGSTTSNGNVSTVLLGSAPVRIRIVQWNVGVDYNAATTNCVFQVWLYESTNVIEYRYGTGAPTGGGAPDKLIALGGAVSTNYINVRPGPMGSTTDSAPLNAWPGNGSIFTFTPPAPCTPPPAPGNTIAAAASGCPGFSTSLSLQNNTAGSGVSYQWQSSPNGVDTWTNLGTSIATHNTGSLAITTWFRCEVTCSTGPSTVSSTPVQIVVSEPAPTYAVYAGVQLTESFSTWTNRCSTSDVPTTSWRNAPAFGAGTWRQSNTSTGASGWNNISGAFTATTVAANPNAVPISYPSARFHSRQGGSVVGTLDYFVDMSAGTGAEFLRFEYINSAGGGNLAVFVSTDGGANFSQVGTTLLTTAINTWVTQHFSIGSTSPTTVIRLRGTAAASATGNDIGVDNFRIIPAATCTAPTGASATVTGPGSVDVSWTCASCTGSYYVEYGTTGFTLGTGTVAGPFASSAASINGVALGNYEAYVRQDCGGNGVSSNVGPIAFSIVAGDFCTSAINFAGSNPSDTPTTPSANSTNAQNNFNSSGCNASLPGPDVVLYHDVAAGATLSFTAQTIFGNARMTLSHGGTCPGTTALACSNGGYFTAGTYVDGDGLVTWTNTTCDEQRVYLTVDATQAGSGGAVYIWNYSYVSNGPTCQTPSGLAAQITGISNANISWDATCSGNVIVEYGVAGFNPGSDASTGDGIVLPVSGTNTALSGLSAGVPYDVYVRQDCGDSFSANSAVLNFTIIPGENCAVAIDLANESAPLIASTTGTTDDASSLSCGASGGGDLVYFISVPDGATIDFEALHDYNAVVQVSYGSNCPGTMLTCAAGLDLYTWTNTTGVTQNVYWWQDGTDSGDFLLSWNLQDPCATDSDGDGVVDCLDQCPGGPEPGTACNDGNGSTINDVITGDCQCVGTPVTCTNDLVLEVRTDGNGTQTTWEIRQQGTSDLAQSGGGSYPNNATLTDNTCLPDGCYYLRVFDAGGDGIANGGYVMRTLVGAQRIIDNRDNFTSGSVSAVIGNGGFCLPLGTDKLIFTSCDKLDWVNNQFIVAAENPAVSAQFGVTNTTSGYQFWWFDPNGTYGYSKFRSHATSDGFGTGATRACHARINNWSPNQIPANVLMNVKVRSRVAGVNSNWGPVCRFMIDPVRAACPLTKLMDIPGNAQYSCGVTRTWGGSSLSKVVAKAVDGATQYQFRWNNAELAAPVIRTTTTPVLQLNWSPALPNGTYQVQVRAFKNGVWCITSLPWGDECNVTITGSTAMALNGGNTVATGDAKLAMFPNPNNGEQLTVSLSTVEEGVNTISVDIFDLSGDRVSSRTMAVNDGMVYQVLSLGEMADGMYMVNITAGAQRYTERLVIAK